MSNGMVKFFEAVNHQIELRKRQGECENLPPLTEEHARYLIAKMGLRVDTHYYPADVADVLKEWMKENEPKREWWQLSERYKRWIDTALKQVTHKYEKAMKQEDLVELGNCAHPTAYEGWQVIFDNDGIAHFDAGNATQECRRHGWRLFKTLFHPQRRHPQEERDKEWYDAVTQSGKHVNEAIRDIAKGLASQEGGYADENQCFWRVKQAYQREKRRRARVGDKFVISEARFLSTAGGSQSKGHRR